MKEGATPTRRDFLKVATVAGLMLPFLSFTETTSSDDTPERPITIDWLPPTQNADIDWYFKLADNPLQWWDYKYQIADDKLLYGLAVNATVAPSVLEPDKLLYISNQPVVEMYTQSVRLSEAGIFENTEGRLVRTSVDPRIVSDAINKYFHTYIVDFFLYRLAAVPKDIVAKFATPPQQIKDQKMPQEAEQFITSGPLAQPEIETIVHPIAYHPIESASRPLFSNTIRVTGKDGYYSYYTANVRKRDQVT